MPEDNKNASGLHATAKVFVPVAPKADSKGAETAKPAAGTSADAPASSSNSSATSGSASSGNGAVASTGLQANGKGTSNAAAQQGGKAGGAGGKGSKAAANAKQPTGPGVSKLAAAASAPPFVPGKTGWCRRSSTISSTTLVSSHGTLGNPVQQPALMVAELVSMCPLWKGVRSDSVCQCKQACVTMHTVQTSNRASPQQAATQAPGSL